MEQPHEKFARFRRAKLKAALSRPLPPTTDDIGADHFFDPWRDIIQGIDGSYSSESDDIMIATLEAVRDRKTFELIEEKGFVVEFMLYVLSGHGLTTYGTSPRGSWPDQPDLWQPLIEKWKAYRELVWT